LRGWALAVCGVAGGVRAACAALAAFVVSLAALSFGGAGSLAGKLCLHISDCVNEASSYERAWAPAIAGTGARICASLTVLDRRQGGGAVLRALDIKHLALASIDADFFSRAHGCGYINERQRSQLLDYIADPNGAMRAFLKTHPGFIADALSGGGRDAERARMCLDGGVYGGAA